jgi:hypothetical protein
MGVDVAAGGGGAVSPHAANRPQTPPSATSAIADFTS